MILRSIFTKNQSLRRCSTHSKSLKELLQSNDPSKVENATVTVKGWVKTVRKMKDNIFFDVSDGSCSEILQVVVPQSRKPHDLTPGASIVVDGRLNATPKGQIELAAENVSLCNPCSVSDGYPFVPRQHFPPDAIREHLHLRTRTNFFGSLLRVRHAATQAVHRHFDAEGFVNVATPILTSNDCEGAGEVFAVVPDNEATLKAMAKPGVAPEKAYFGGKAFLTVSGQLHLEAAAHGLGKVYTFGPVFRAENSKSRLHLSEFYMVEAELAFTDDINRLTACVERLIKSATESVLNDCERDLARLRPKDKQNISWLDKAFSVLTFAEAVALLDQSSDAVLQKGGLTKEQELFLVKRNGEVPVFVVDWPKSIKPFYMRGCEGDPGNVAALDLLVPNVGELVGGGLRENDFKTLRDKLPGNSIDLGWYLDLRKFGSVPTGGFGLGFERYLQLITEISNIKDTIPFPRWPHNCTL